MNVNVSMKKIVICAIVLVVTLLGGKWVKDTAPKREAKSQFNSLVEFAERQAVEIAIIEQAARLQQLKAAVRKSQMKPVPVNSEIPKEVADVDESSDLQSGPDPVR